LAIYASANPPSLGSADTPVAVSTDSLLNLSVSGGGASYFSFRPMRSANHTVAVTGLFTALTWELFEDPGYLHPIQQRLAGSTSGPHEIELDFAFLWRDRTGWSYAADLGWTLFDDAAFAHPVAACRDYRGIRSNSPPMPSSQFEHCIATLVAGVPYYLRVDEQ